MARRSQQESVREGNRWIGNPPGPDEFYDWFKNNVRMHEGLSHDDYFGGVVLLPQKEKYRRTVNDQIIEEERLTFSPYPQVETRVRYFWDWCAAKSVTGEIVPVPREEPVKNLPPEVWQMSLEGQRGPVVWLGATYAVQAYYEGDKDAGVFMSPVQGTKMVELYGRYGPDVNAPMRSQTGAIGRALGFAGMLVLPGSGISSAEDIQDAISTSAIASTGASLPAQSPVKAATATPEPPTAAEQGEEPRTPTGADGAAQEAAEQRERILATLAELKADFPGAHNEIVQWADERELDLDNPPADMLDGLHRKLTRKLATARRALN